MSLSDSRRMWKLLNEASREGVHSHDLRRLGVSGNPSQRAKDIAEHVGVWTARENVGKRPGSRYWLIEHAPDWAVPVKPNVSDPSQVADPSTRATSHAVDSPPSATPGGGKLCWVWDSGWKREPIPQWVLNFTRTGGTISTQYKCPRDARTSGGRTQRSSSVSAQQPNESGPVMREAA